MANVFSGICNIGRDCEVKQTNSGAVLTVALANTVGYGDKQKTVWLRGTLWGKRAESKIVDYLKKGQQVFVSGELSLNEYTGNDGVKKTALELNLNIIDLLGGKKDGQSQQYNQAPAPVASYAPAPAPQYQTPHQQHAQAVQQHNQTSAAPVYDDDVPF